jgi:hypothetical protein
LERDTGMPTETVAKALADYELPWGCVLRHNLKQLVNAALGRPTRRLRKPAKIELDDRTIFVVDEAAMTQRNFFVTRSRKVRWSYSVAT